ncbi:MAG: hypothetical protein GX542_06330 [Rhodococcus sp.]|nr:hypothetical protein [Rhodococcus sp. (in: high G+C Gram-positive bacteria)]
MQESQSFNDASLPESEEVSGFGPPRESISRTILELRIHGVGNTPPANSLDLPPEYVEMAAGDELGGFWKPKRRVFTPRSSVRGVAPDPDVHLEAYSWGKLARTSFSTSNRVASGLARLGWMLLIPFGLVNVAYWGRRLDHGRSTRPDPRFAGTLRLAGLLLTLLLATSASVIALDLFAVQCSGGQCAAVSGVLGFADEWTIGQRLAAGSLVPVLLVVALVGLGAATRARYERPNPVSGCSTNSEPEACAKKPLLSQPHFWGHQAITLTAAGVHASATAALVSLGTAWHFAFARHPQCQRLETLGGSGCRSEAFGPESNSAALLMVALSLIVLLWAGIVLIRRNDLSSPKKRVLPLVDRARYVCLAAVTIFVVQLILLAFEPRETQPDSPHLVGMSAMPSMLLAGLLAISVSALLWRQTVHWDSFFHYLPNVIGVVFSVSLLTVGFFPHLWWVIAVPVAIGLLIFYLTRNCHDNAWRGTGPGIGLIAATVTAMLFSTSVVAVAGGILNGPAPVTALSTPEYSDNAHNLLIPLPYMWFGGASIPAMIIMAAVIALAVLGSSRWESPAPADPDGTDTIVLRIHRRVAAIAQRAEGYVAALAIVGGCAASAALVLAVADASLPAGSVVRGPVGVGVWLMAAMGIAFGVAVLFRGASGSTRPVGLIWDLICFLPRGGHPLGPPCYAERVVPEIAWRCREWLDGDDGTGSQRRTVVLSAHSLGSVLAVAVILSPILTDEHRQRISLITYGSQLRAYFGRIFPELIGPKVVGAPAGTSSSLISPNPWRSDEKKKLKPKEPSPNTLIDVLSDDEGTIRWRNLWRRTDYIGFPVWGYPGSGENPVDRPAEEIDDSGYLNQIATHGNYPRSRAYRQSIRELCDLATMDQKPPLPEDEVSDSVRGDAVESGTGEISTVDLGEVTPCSATSDLVARESGTIRP